MSIWEEILGREGIGIHDNFFDLGGHSLKAIKLVSRVSKNYDVKIDLSYLFKHPNIEFISKYIIAAGRTKDKHQEQTGEELFF